MQFYQKISELSQIFPKICMCSKRAKNQSWVYKIVWRIGKKYAFVAIFSRYSTSSVIITYLHVDKRANTRNELSCIQTKAMHSQALLVSKAVLPIFLISDLYLNSLWEIILSMSAKIVCQFVSKIILLTDLMKYIDWPLIRFWKTIPIHSQMVLE